MTEDDSPRTMKTVETSWDVIHALEKFDGAGVTELSDYLDVPKGTIYTHLATLRERKYVVKENNEYHLSLHFLSLGEYVKNDDILYNAGKPEVDRLAEETQEYVHLVTEEHGELIYLHEARGENAVGKDYFSRKFEKPGHLHSSSYGKAILAYLPDDRVEAIIDESGLPKRTENTITTKDALFEELAEIRDRGYALNDEEEILGTRAVGAPILDRNDVVLGAISVTKPTSRMQDEEFRETVPNVVTSTANVIEVNVQTIRNREMDAD
jgi:DNA-binding IclR family transcriptional regulator